MTDQTEAGEVKGFTLAGDQLTVTLTFPHRCVNVAVGKGSNLSNGFDLSDFTPDLLAYAAIQGFAKALSDRSEKGATATDLKALRDKRIDTWKGGDWAGKGGGVPNPLQATMKEIAVNRLVKSGRSQSEAIKQIGSLKSFITALAMDKIGDEKKVAEIETEATRMLDGLEKEARAMIAKREANKAETKALVDLF